MPPLETVIAIMNGSGQRRHFKVHKSVAEISAADLEALDSSTHDHAARKLSSRSRGQEH